MCSHNQTCFQKLLLTSFGCIWSGVQHRNLSVVCGKYTQVEDFLVVSHILPACLSAPQSEMLLTAFSLFYTVTSQTSSITHQTTVSYLLYLLRLSYSGWKHWLVRQPHLKARYTADSLSTITV